MAFAASRNGHFPSALSFISITQFTPVVSVIFIVSWLVDWLIDWQIYWLIDWLIDLQGVVIVLFIWAFEAEFILVNVTFSGIIGDLLISIGYLRRRLKTRIHDDLKFKVNWFGAAVVHKIFNCINQHAYIIWAECIMSHFFTSCLSELWRPKQEGN